MRLWCPGSHNLLATGVLGPQTALTHLLDSATLENTGFCHIRQAYNARNGSTYTLAATSGCGLSVSGTGQNSRWCSMTPLLILWAGLTVVLIVLLIYRSTLSMHEDDQLFLGNSEAHMAKEQQDLIVKMNRIEPWVSVCGAGSAVLFFLIAGIMLYTRFTIYR